MRVVRGLVLGMLLAATSGLWSEARAQSSSILATTILGIPDIVAREELATFTVVLSNTGTAPEPAGRTVTIVTNPTQLTFLDATPRAGEATSFVDNGDGTIDWIIDELEAGGERKLVIDVRPILAGAAQVRSEIDPSNFFTRDFSIVDANIVTSINNIPDPAVQGTEFSFNITMENQDSFSIEPGTDMEILFDPLSLTYVDQGAPPESTVTLVAPGQLLWALLPTGQRFGPGETRALPLTFKADDSGSPHILAVTNSTSSDTKTVNVSPAPVITTTILGIPDFVAIEELMTFTVVLTNFGDAPEPAGRTVTIVTDPTQLTFLDARPRSGEATSFVDNGDGTIDWIIDEVEPGGERKLVVDTIPILEGDARAAALGNFVVTATVPPDSIDNSDNQDSLTIDVTDDPNLQITEGPTRASRIRSGRRRSIRRSAIRPVRSRRR